MELPKRAEIESSFAAKTARLLSSQRRELERLLGFPPDPSKVPASFWTESERELNEQLAAVLLLIWIMSAEHHGWDGGMSDGEAFANAHAREVAAGFTATTRDRLASQTWGPDVTHSELQADLVSILGPDRAAMLAVTETTVAQTMGGEAGIAATVGLDDADEWKTNPGLSQTGPCPVCEPLDGTPRSIWAAQFPSGPPGPHVGCVCEIIYQRALALT